MLTGSTPMQALAGIKPGATGTLADRPSDASPASAKTDASPASAQADVSQAGALADVSQAGALADVSQAAAQADASRTGALADGPLNASQAGTLAGAFKALGDPVRLRLLSMIASAEDGEVCVCDLSSSFPLTGPTISHHLRILREAGLVDTARRGTWVYYRPVPASLARLAGLLGAPAIS